MSSLVSVVGNDFVDDWKALIVPARDPLAQFHAKFCGVQNTEGDDIEIDHSTAVEDDINAGCYILDIDIPGIKEKIWVRADYIRMFKFAEEFYTESVTDRSPCLVITGQRMSGLCNRLWTTISPPSQGYLVTPQVDP